MFFDDETNVTIQVFRIRELTFSSRASECYTEKNNHGSSISAGAMTSTAESLPFQTGSSTLEAFQPR